MSLLSPPRRSRLTDAVAQQGLLLRKAPQRVLLLLHNPPHFGQREGRRHVRLRIGRRRRGCSSNSNSTGNSGRGCSSRVAGRPDQPAVRACLRPEAAEPTALKRTSRPRPRFSLLGAGAPVSQMRAALLGRHIALALLLLPGTPQRDQLAGAPRKDSQLSWAEAMAMIRA